MSLFRKLGLWTVFAVYFLILVGGIVRATGSGMGCPDWPRCFGMWIPPTSVSELPPNYQEIFGAKLKGEVEFVAFKTWTEYINRLIGVLIGFLIFGTLLASIRYLKSDKTIFWLSLTAFVLVGFQGWLGSKVVSTELLPVMVTIHFWVALLIVFVLIYAVLRSYTGYIAIENLKNPQSISWILLGLMLLTVVQIVTGTQVREGVDMALKTLGENQRATWLDWVGGRFTLHRSFSWLIVASHLYFLYLLKKNRTEIKTISKFFNYVLYLLFAEFLLGITMNYFAIPAFAQPLHLTFATLMLGGQFAVWVMIAKRQTFSQLSII